jgi:CheY-like chemotaxis protein
MDFAQSADSALKLISDAAGASLILILSDINMPGMTGVCTENPIRVDDVTE